MTTTTEQGEQEFKVLPRYCYCDTEKGQINCGECEYAEDGKDEQCGKPGHLCHYPGMLPYTGSWCDYHYYVLSRNINGANDKFREQF